MAPAPESAAGEIVKHTYTNAEGKEVSGWVFQSGPTWRYRRAARYPYWFPSYGYGYGYGAVITPRIRHYSTPVVRSTHSTVSRSSNPGSIRPAGPSFGSGGRVSIRPMPTPTIVRSTQATAVRPAATTVRRTTTAAAPGARKSKTTVRVYRRP